MMTTTATRMIRLVRILDRLRLTASAYRVAFSFLFCTSSRSSAMILSSLSFIVHPPFALIYAIGEQTASGTDRPCPQLDDWPCLAEASASGLTSASCYHVEENILVVAIVEAANIRFPFPLWEGVRG